MSNHQIDLCLWSERNSSIEWQLGRVCQFSECTKLEQINDWVRASQSTFTIFWADPATLPAKETLEALIEDGVDVAHAGLAMGTGELLPDLYLVKQDWSMINAPANRSSCSWRLTLNACLIRRDLFIRVGGLDTAFTSRDVAALEFGYRCINLGALIEHRPELIVEHPTALTSSAQDLYSFILRHYGMRWAQYVLIRRCLRLHRAWIEVQAWQKAVHACASIQGPLSTAETVWYEPELQSHESSIEPAVTVIIPTLGRYPYLPDALNSLRTQTVKPREVIVVDQNSAAQRKPEVYSNYEDLNLHVIWQDERGQSLARNTGVDAATQPYIFMFDDDSLADEQLIEKHFNILRNGRFDVSTGVAYPPPPEGYELPANYQYPRIAQTLDTGNCMMSLSIFKQIGGLDRNYDFGPGTDADLGTRLYLAGFRIAHNPSAKRIHFKAPMGGLRTHNAHKYTTDTGLLQPFPPVTQSYYTLRYWMPNQQRERTLLQFVVSKFPQQIRRQKESQKETFKALCKFSIYLLFLPIKWYYSRRKANMLLQRGPRLGFHFNEGESINDSQIRK